MYWSITFEDLCLAGISERVGSLLDPAYCSWPFLLGLGLTYGRHMAHLNLSMRTGIPKWLRPDRRQTLMREGIYRVVRHPIYLIAAVAGDLLRAGDQLPRRLHPVRVGIASSVLHHHMWKSANSLPASERSTGSISEKSPD